MMRTTMTMMTTTTIGTTIITNMTTTMMTLMASLIPCVRIRAMAVTTRALVTTRAVTTTMTTMTIMPMMMTSDDDIVGVHWWYLSLKHCEGYHRQQSYQSE